MTRVEVDIDDQISPRLKEFGTRAPTVMRRICRTVGQDFRAYTKKNYLRGQIIGKRTGTLYKDFKIVNDRRDKLGVIARPSARLANIYHNPAGADIRPSLKKVLRFFVQGEPVFAKHVHLDPRPWMNIARNAFGWDASIVRSADKVIDREMKKLGLNNGAG